MGFIAPAMPWILQGGAALASGLLGKKSQTSAMQRSPEEKLALGGAQNAAIGMQQTGAGLIKSGQGTTGRGVNTIQQGIDTLSGPASYWSRLLGGNRASMAQATAAPRGAITDVYRGAEKGLERSGVRGAQRDVAKSELGRDRAGKIAGLTTGVQPMAAQNLADIGDRYGNMGAVLAGAGTDTTRTGAGLQGNAASIFSSLLGQGAANRAYGRQEGENTSRNIGSFLFDMLSGIMKNRRGGGGGDPDPWRD